MTDHRQRRISIVKLLMAIACLAGCDLPGKPDRQQQPVPADKVADFATLYQTSCAGCHGAEGNFGPAPPLNDPLFLTIISDDALLNVVTHGRAGTPMPAFAREHGGSLTGAQITIIADGVKSHWRGDAANRSDTPPYVLTAVADATSTSQAQRGATVFARACADCHGANGEGGFAGAIHDSAFLALISDQALRRIMITGRADLGMPNYFETDGRADDFTPLTSGEIDDLIALLSGWRTSASENVLATDSPAGVHGRTTE